jgi:two-component system, NarL family, nitrate/nitrite response regulator NarL
MDHEIAYNEPSVSRTPGPVDPVTTYLICRNTLLRTGIGHLLSGSRFVMAEETVKDLSDLSTIVGQEPALVLLGESLTVDTCIDCDPRDAADRIPIRPSGHDGR